MNGNTRQDKNNTRFFETSLLHHVRLKSKKSANGNMKKQKIIDIQIGGVIDRCNDNVITTISLEMQKECHKLMKRNEDILDKFSKCFRNVNTPLSDELQKIDNDIRILGERKKNITNQMTQNKKDLDQKYLDETAHIVTEIAENEKIFLKRAREEIDIALRKEFPEYCN